ncbi:gamma-glutamylcyclotransferase [Haloferula sp. BvORR071]|uniref:gamma-glutamylcyclotransferase family protein n=1 Tax=Haloferula sp. BvORR071 TaxID=1396141 RepID=UPI00054D636B|nr:gamma-glutamylcyclotransferase [Haloferula sp. BvORR071]
MMPLRPQAVELVFVYGPLRRRASNAGRLKGAEWVSAAVIRGKLLKIGWFPALVLDPQADSWVWGDVFRVRAGDNLDAFLEYEGLEGGAVDGKDCRMVETAVRASPMSVIGWDVQLWAWTGSVEEAELVPSGDWIDLERPGERNLFSWLAAACALTMPGIAVTTAFVPDLPFEEAFIVCATLAPIAGWFAIYFASRRRERWETLRLYILTALFLESIPVVTWLGTFISTMIQRIF